MFGEVEKVSEAMLTDQTAEVGGGIDWEAKVVGHGSKAADV